MAIEPEVRRAVPDDRDECVAIDNDGRAGVADQRGGEAWLASHPSLSSMAEWPSTWVGSIDGVIVGFLCGRVDEVESRGLVYVVDRIYVRSEAREIGFGDALLAAALGEAVESGCRFFEGVALPGDRETKNLYERAGITARSITVSRRIS